MSMNDSEIARLLYFTRAAVEDDSALLGARIGYPASDWFGRVWAESPQDEVGWPPVKDITAPLSMAGIYRLWDNEDTAAKCHRCGSRMLFLRLNGPNGHLMQHSGFLRECGVRCKPVG